MRRIIFVGSLLAIFSLVFSPYAQAQETNSSTLVYEAYQAGKAKAGEKDFEAAVAKYKEALEVGDPEKDYDAKIMDAARKGIAAAALNQATELRNAKDYAASLEAYLEAMKIGEESGSDKVVNIARANGTRVAYVLGNDLKKSEDFEGALGAYRKGIMLDSTFYKNFLGEAQALEEADEVAASVKAYLKAAKLCEADEDEEVVAKAEKMFSKAENMIAVASSNKKWEATADAANVFLEEQGDNAEVYYYLSQAQQGQNQLADAMTHIDKAIELASDDKFYMQKAEVFEALGNTQEAINAYKKVSDNKYKERADYKINELEGGK